MKAVIGSSGLRSHTRIQRKGAKTLATRLTPAQYYSELQGMGVGPSEARRYIGETYMPWWRSASDALTPIGTSTVRPTRTQPSQPWAGTQSSAGTYRVQIPGYGLISNPGGFGTRTIYPTPQELYEAYAQGPGVKPTDAQVERYVRESYAPWYADVLMPARMSVGYGGEITIPPPPAFGTKYNAKSYGVAPTEADYAADIAAGGVDFTSALDALRGELTAQSAEMQQLYADLAANNERSAMAEAILLQLLSGGGETSREAYSPYYYGTYYPGNGGG